MTALKESTSEPPVASPAPSRSTPYIWPTAAVVILAATLPWALGVPDPRSAVLAEAVLVVCLWGLYRSFARGARPCQIVFWAFTFAWLGIGPLYQLYLRQVAWRDATLLLQTGRVLEAQVLLLVALLAFMAGTYRSKPVARRPLPLRPETLERVTLALLVLALVVLPLAISTSGGHLTDLFAARQERASVLTAAGGATGGATRGFGSLLPSAIAAAVAYYGGLLARAELRRPMVEWRPRILLAATAAVVFLAIYSNPLANSRFVSLSAIGCFALGLIQPRTRRAGSVLAAATAFGLLFVYPLLYAFRQAARLSDLGTFNIEDWAGQDFDGFQQWVNSLQFVSEQGHSDGSFTLSALLFFVPRSVWPTKELPASLAVADNRGYDFTDLSLPISAEFYIDFGIVGMVVLLFVMGRVWERLDSAWSSDPRSAAALLCPVVATQQLGLLRGPLGSLVPVVATVLLLSSSGYFVQLLARRPAPDAGTDPKSVAHPSRRPSAHHPRRRR